MKLDLGFISKGQFVPEVENAAFTLAAGTYSDVIESPYGFHIVRVADKELVPLSEVQNQIRPNLLADQVTKDIEARVRAVGVEVNEEFFKQ